VEQVFSVGCMILSGAPDPGWRRVRRRASACRQPRGCAACALKLLPACPVPGLRRRRGDGRPL